AGRSLGGIMSAAKISAIRLAAPSDSSLLARVAEGDMSALGVLYDRYAAALLRFAQRIAPREAEDGVQIVFLRVVKLAVTFERDAVSARPWLFAITSRVAQERKRALRRWTRALMRMSDQPPRPHGNPDARRDLDRGLARLSMDKRTVLVLAEIEG